MGKMKWQMAWALAEGERERWKGEWVRWEEGGWVLYSVEPLLGDTLRTKGSVPWPEQIRGVT